MKYKKGFASIAVLLGILGVAVVVVGVYFLATSPKKTTNNYEDYSPIFEDNTNALDTEQTNNIPQTSIQTNVQSTPPSTPTTPITNNQTPPSQPTPITEPLDTSVAVDPCLSINNQSFTRVQPNGGTYFIGQTMTIWWETCNILSNDLVKVSIETSPSGGGTSLTLLEGTPNDGKEIVSLVDNITAGIYWIKVSSVSDTSVNIISDSSFTIEEAEGTPLITVLSPNGGEVISSGSPITISWSSVNVPSNANVRISLSREISGGVTSTPLSATTGTPNTGQETYVIPSHIQAGNNYKIYISTDYFGTNNYIGDESDQFFTIQ